MGQALNKLVGKDGAGNGEGLSKEAAVAKTAGLFVFSGIAMSILKALSPYNDNNKLQTHSVTEQTQSAEPFHSHSHSGEPVFKEKRTCTEQDVRDSREKTIDIVKGDTLWGLSRKYGVSIDAIKDANGLTGDTIYAGKKLVIP